ncbi:MAG TPA: L,D-transpeptidase family protein [Phenylobacterium sp.]|nr:L,D-transpeptidase family protein [Phenylobacterium sp.]
MSILNSRFRAGFAGVVLALSLGMGGQAASAAEPPPAPPLSASDRRLLLEALQASANAPPAPLDDARLAEAIQQWARTEAGLRVQPSLIDRFWALEPPRRDVAQGFDQARRSGAIGPWLSSLGPSDLRYRALIQARERYRRLVAAGGWSALPASGVLSKDSKNSKGPAVLALRQRLAAEGYQTGAGAEPDRFDPELTAAVAMFQQRHGLQADGVVGRATRVALDVPAATRLTQIDANLERWRWLPRPLPSDRIEVDIGRAEAVLYRADQPRLSMRAVVGASATRTPMFASRLEAVVFNPPWNVPSSIASKEIYPKAARDPGYLARHHYVSGPSGLQQLPGPDNALGRVKFDLPSPFGVYLHDTPGRGVFARPMRALSHGCMRLEKPLELAAELLGTQGWDRTAVDEAVAAGETRRVGLTKSVPLFVVYRTAFVDETGDVEFRADVYGWDAKLSEALLASR